MTPRDIAIGRTPSSNCSPTGRLPPRMWPPRRGAVRAARSRRGICRTRWTAEEIGRLRDYAASPKQIAAETGRSLSAVYAKRSEMGLPTPAAMRAAAREAAAATASRAASGRIGLHP